MRRRNIFLSLIILAFFAFLFFGSIFLFLLEKGGFFSSDDDDSRTRHRHHTHRPVAPAPTKNPAPFPTAFTTAPTLNPTPFPSAFTTAPTLSPTPSPTAACIANGEGPSVFGVCENGCACTCYDNASNPISACTSYSDVPAKRFRLVSSGLFYLCFISDNVYCTGDGQHGKLGDGTAASSLVPVQVDNSLLTSARAVYTGRYTTCAITNDLARAVYCWGDNSLNIIRNTATPDYLTPTSIEAPLDSSVPVRSLCLAAGHACAIREADGKLFCWGYNAFGQLGDGTTTNRQVPTEVLGALQNQEVSEVTCSFYHTCAIRASDSRLFCWGDGGSGNIGDGTYASYSLPVTVASPFDVEPALSVQSSVEFPHSCAISGSTRFLYCWGLNTYGQLGTGDTSNRGTPTMVSGILGFTQVALVGMGALHTCAATLSAPSRLYCWGFDGIGEIGDTGGTSGGNVLLPSLVVQLANDTTNSVVYSQISAGWHETCGITNTRELYCWGRNDEGQLGINSTFSKNNPARLLDFSVGEFGITAPCLEGSAPKCFQSRPENSAFPTASPLPAPSVSPSVSPTPFPTASPTTGCIDWNFLISPNGWTSSSGDGCAASSHATVASVWSSGAGWFDGPGLTPSINYTGLTKQKMVSPAFNAASGVTDLLRITFSLDSEVDYDYFCVAQIDSMNISLPISLDSSVLYSSFSPNTTYSYPTDHCVDTANEHCVSFNSGIAQSDAAFNLSPSLNSRIVISFTSDPLVQLEGFLLTRTSVCNSPSRLPTVSPSQPPSQLPTVLPSQPPSQLPTVSPSQPPSQLPTVSPSQPPSQLPTVSPSQPPSQLPTVSSTQPPSQLPTVSPTAPALSPTPSPTAPTLSPTPSPTAPTLSPTPS
jgi:alpha-tubulin suppressor-like RCC1 family protein